MARGGQGGAIIVRGGGGRYERATRGARTHLIESTCNGKGQDSNDIHNYEQDNIPFVDERAWMKMVVKIHCRN